MNYSGNMPDWHQYNPVQPLGPEASPVGQNVNPSPIYGSSVSPRTSNGPNVSPEGLNKQQSDANYSPRNFQQSPGTLNGSNGPDHSPLGPMVQMAGCIGHYGTSSPRNPMMENLSSPLDPRNGPVGPLNEPIPHRSSQMPVNGPLGHLNGPSLNGQIGGLNSPLGSMGSRNPPMGPMPPGRQVPGPYVPCKGPCCNPDPNLGYPNWEKFGPYPPNMSYRENMGQSSYSVDNRRYNNDFNLRKDGYESKEPLGPGPYTIDPRRSFPDYKYRKDSMIPRGYAPPPGVSQNYPVQNYNFSGEYPKYPAYPIKDYPRENPLPNAQNPNVLKYHEQSVIVQQRYTTKQIQYPNGVLPKGTIPPNMGANIISRAQNPYFNPQLARDFPRDFSEGSSLASRGMQTSTPIHGSYPKYQMYQQKIAMQRFSMENHLRELTRIPGYQSHPKYQECVLRYRELLRLQQTVEYQSTVQGAARVVTPQVNEDIPPINLQFDQNGVLINTSFVPSGLSGVQNPVNAQNLENMQNVNNSETEHQNLQHPEHFQSQESVENRLQSQDSPSLHRAELACDNLEHYSIQKDYSQEQFRMQRYESESFDSLNPDNRETAVSMHHRNSRDFADKPELDVRQFLATWDESEEEDGANVNLPDVVLSNSTSLVVVEYENTQVVSENPEDGGSFQQTGDCRGIENCGEPENSQNDTKSTKYDKTQNRENIECSEQNSDGSRSLNNIAKTSSVIQCTNQGTKGVSTTRITENLECNETTQRKLRPDAEKLETSDSEMVEKSLDTVTDAGNMTKVLSNAEETISSIKEHIASYNQEEIAETHSPVGTISNDDRDSSSSRKKSSADLTDTFGSNESLSGSESKNDTKTDTSSSFKKSPERIQGTEIHVDAHELSNLPMSPKNNPGSTENSNLRKQSSFTSEESHNTDDISLPDLPTSECTPISTTLNTPTHSDSEESSEHVIDLTIPTNPIEIIQNSPMLSFTHSPIKMEPYEHLDDDDLMEKRSLDFDFQEGDRCKNDYDKPNAVDCRRNEDYETTSDDDDDRSKCDSILSSKDYLKRDREVVTNDNGDTSNAVSDTDNSAIKKQRSVDKTNIMATNEVDSNITDSDNQPWLSMASMEHKRQTSDKKEINESLNVVESSEISSDTDKGSSESSQSSENDSEDIENVMSTSEDCKVIISNQQKPSISHIPKYEIEDDKCLLSENKVISNLTTDDGMKLDSSGSICKTIDCQLDSEGSKNISSNSNHDIDFTNSDENEMCCSGIQEARMFHTSPEHEKLYTSALEQDKIYIQSIENQSHFSGTTSIIPLIPGEDFEEPKIPVPPMEGNCLTKIIKNTSPITNLDVLGSDDEKLDKMDDIWMDVGCVETVVKPSEVHSNTYAECRKNSHPERNSFLKKLRKVQKNGWKHTKSVTKGKDVRKSIRKILKARKERLNSRSEISKCDSEQQFYDQTENSIVAAIEDRTKVFEEDSRSAVTEGTDKTVAILQENLSKTDCSGFQKYPVKSIAQDNKAVHEKASASLPVSRENSIGEPIRSQEKGNHINDIATKLLENARLFEPELRRMEVLRKESSSGENSRDSSKERIKLLKEFRKVKNKSKTINQAEDKAFVHSSGSLGSGDGNSLSVAEIKLPYVKPDPVGEEARFLRRRDIDEIVSPDTGNSLEPIERTDADLATKISLPVIKKINKSCEENSSSSPTASVFLEKQKQLINTFGMTDAQKEKKPDLQTEESYTTKDGGKISSVLNEMIENEPGINLLQSESTCGSHKHLSTQKSSETDRETMKKHDVPTPSQVEEHISCMSEHTGFIQREMNNENNNNTSPVVAEQVDCNVSDLPTPIPNDTNIVNNEITYFEESRDDGSIKNLAENTLADCTTTEDNTGALENTFKSVEVFDSIEIQENAVGSCVSNESRDDNNEHTEEPLDNLEGEEVSVETFFSEEDIKKGLEKPLDTYCENSKESPGKLLNTENSSDTCMPQGHANEEPNTSEYNDKKKNEKPCDPTGNTKNLNTMRNSDNIENIEVNESLENHEEPLKNFEDIGQVFSLKQLVEGDNQPDDCGGKSIDPSEIGGCETSIELMNLSDKVDDTQHLLISIAKENIAANFSGERSENSLVNVENVTNPSDNNLNSKKSECIEISDTSKECVEFIPREDSTKVLKKVEDESFDEIDLPVGTFRSPNTADVSFETFGLDNSFHFDFNNFDVAPNESNTAENDQMESWKYSKAHSRFEDCERYKNPDSYVNPIFTSLDTLENLNTVPVYTTKDGKVTYSPNPKFTYRALIMEARKREGYPVMRDSYYVNPRAPDDYNYSKQQNSYRKRKYTEGFGYGNASSYTKKNYFEYFEPRTHAGSSPKYLTDFRHKNSLNYNKYCHQARDKVSCNLTYYNYASDKKYNPTAFAQGTVFNKYNTREEYIAFEEYNRRKNGTVDFRYHGKKLYKQSVGRAVDAKQLINKCDMILETAPAKPGTTMSHTNKKIQLKDPVNTEKYLHNANKDSYLKRSTLDKPLAKVEPSTLHSYDKCSEKKNSGTITTALVPVSSQAENILPKDTICVSDLLEISRKEYTKKVMRNSNMLLGLLTSEWENMESYENFISYQKKDTKQIPPKILLDSELEEVYAEQMKLVDDYVFHKDNKTNDSKSIRSNKEELDPNSSFVSGNDHSDEGNVNLEKSILENERKGEFEENKSATLERNTEIHSVTCFETQEPDRNTEKEELEAENKNDFIEKCSSEQKIDDCVHVEEHLRDNDAKMTNIKNCSSERKQIDEEIQINLLEEQESSSNHTELKISEECQETKNDMLNRNSETNCQNANVTDLQEGFETNAEDEHSVKDYIELQKKEESVDRLEVSDDEKYLDSEVISCSLQGMKIQLDTNNDKSNNCEAEACTTHQQEFIINDKNADSIKCLSSSHREEENPIQIEINVDHGENPAEKIPCLEQKELEMKVKDSDSIESLSSLQGNEEDFIQIERNIEYCKEKKFSSQQRKLEESHITENSLDENQEQYPDRFQITERDFAVNKVKSTQEDTYSMEEPYSGSRNGSLVNHLGERIDSDVLLQKEESRNNAILKLQTQFEKYTAYSPSNEGSDDKIVPKLVIKKTETLNSKNTSPRSSTDSSMENGADKEEPGSKVSVHPKIPKMIIRNARSRPSTPSIEEILEDSISSKTVKEEHKVFKVKIKLEDKASRSRPVTPLNEIASKTNVIENKIPKMKIKLEDKLPKVIIKALTAEDFTVNKDTKKTIPKMKIKKVRSAQPKIVDVKILPIPLPKAVICKRSRTNVKTNIESKVEKGPTKCDNNLELVSSNSDTCLENVVKVNESLTTDIEEIKEKIPKLKIKRQSSSSSTESRKRHNSSPLQVEYKKVRKSVKTTDTTDKKQSHKLKIVPECLPEDMKKSEKHSTREHNDDLVSENTKYLSEPNIKFKPDPSVISESVSEKIPKVIIKRTSPSAEFKCELSKGTKDAIIKNKKWQPEVKLQRSWVLDCMAKDLRLDKLTLKLATPESIAKKSAAQRKPGAKRSHLKKDNINVERDTNNLIRSKSATDITPADRKPRRLSDFDVMRLEDTDALLMPRKVNTRKRCKSDMSQNFSKCSENFKKIDDLRCCIDLNTTHYSSQHMHGLNSTKPRLLESDENVRDTNFSKKKTPDAKLMFNEYYQKIKTLKKSYGRPRSFENDSQASKNVEQCEKVSEDRIGSPCKILDENMNSKNKIPMESVRFDDLTLNPGRSDMSIAGFPVHSVSYETTIETTVSDNDSLNNSMFEIDNPKECYENYDASASDMTTDTSFEIVDANFHYSSDIMRKKFDENIFNKIHNSTNPRNHFIDDKRTKVIANDIIQYEKAMLDDNTVSSIENVANTKITLHASMNVVDHYETVTNLSDTINNSVIFQEITTMKPTDDSSHTANYHTVSAADKNDLNFGIVDESLVNSAKQTLSNAVISSDTSKKYEENKSESYERSTVNQENLIDSADVNKIIELNFIDSIDNSFMNGKCEDVTKDSGILNENHVPNSEIARNNSSLNTCEHDVHMLDNTAATLNASLDNSNDVANSVIKVESSDESQTTIEILAASDLSQSEMEINSCPENREETCVCLYSEDAIPTQFELELELADNIMPDPLDVPMPEAFQCTEEIENDRNVDELIGGNDCLTADCFDNKPIDTSYLDNVHPETANDCEKPTKGRSSNRAISTESLTYLVEENSTSDIEPQAAISHSSIESNVNLSSTIEKSFCCSDLLVKEVLAAKEALRKCLSKSRSDAKTKFKTRPKTAAEKKQGSSFDLSTLQNSNKNFPKLKNCYSNNLNNSDDGLKWMCQGYNVVNQEEGTNNNHTKTESKIITEKSERKHSKSDKSYSMGRKFKSKVPSTNIEGGTGLIRLVGHTISRLGSRNTLGSTEDDMTISLKNSKHLIKSISNSDTSISSPEIINSKDTKYKSKSPRRDVESESFRKPKNLAPNAMSQKLRIDFRQHDKKLQEKPEDSTEKSALSMDKSKYKASKRSLEKHDVQHRVTETAKTKTYKIPRISKSKTSANDKLRDVHGETRGKEDKMPVLEPQIDLNGSFENFELNCDQETSRSPPVITSQETERVYEDASGNVEIVQCREFMTKGAEIRSEVKVPEEEVKVDAVYQGKETTVADIVNELAYHEKATIRHRRYCTLCERWFPTVARHRRHLTGYQHRHTELTQRRTVHALFTLFTGRPCPRLQPAEVVRTDCTPGEPTPLQIAVQDVTKELNESDDNARKLTKEGEK